MDNQLMHPEKFERLGFTHKDNEMHPPRKPVVDNKEDEGFHTRVVTSNNPFVWKGLIKWEQVARIWSTYKAKWYPEDD